MHHNDMGAAECLAGGSEQSLSCWCWSCRGYFYATELQRFSAEAQRLAHRGMKHERLRERPWCRSRVRLLTVRSPVGDVESWSPRHFDDRVDDFLARLISRHVCVRERFEYWMQYVPLVLDGGVGLEGRVVLFGVPSTDLEWSAPWEFKSVPAGSVQLADWRRRLDLSEAAAFGCWLHSTGYWTESECRRASSLYDAVAFFGDVLHEDFPRGLPDDLLADMRWLYPREV